jgi:hypothetical protein
MCGNACDWAFVGCCGVKGLEKPVIGYGEKYK